ncbi:MAG TPA: hypothetical protein VGM90_03430 [Kofleriaceae bacterium]
MSKKKGAQKSRDRGLQKQVRERQRRTGESYQLAWRRVTDAIQTLGPMSQFAGPLTIDQLLERDRRQRAAPPLSRPEYATSAEDREAAFGFERRVVMTPKRMGDEPDRMYAVAAEMLGIAGHLFAMKLATGGYEIRTADTSDFIDLVPSFDQLIARYGTQRRLPFDAFALPSGTDTAETLLAQARLGRVLLERFQTVEFTNAVRAAEPERKFVHFGSPRFEVINGASRYARFSVEYVDLLKDGKNIHDGVLRGEVAIDATVGDDKAVAEGLRLVGMRVFGRDGVERDMTLEARMKSERQYQPSVDGHALLPTESCLGDGPFSLVELADAHRKVPPAHVLLVKKADRELGDYHVPFIVYEMKILGWVKDGYRTLTTTEIDRMYPAVAKNVEALTT